MSTDSQLEFARMCWLTDDEIVAVVSECGRRAAQGLGGDRTGVRYS